MPVPIRRGEGGEKAKPGVRTFFRVTLIRPSLVGGMPKLLRKKKNEGSVTPRMQQRRAPLVSPNHRDPENH